MERRKIKKHYIIILLSLIFTLTLLFCTVNVALANNSESYNQTKVSQDKNLIFEYDNTRF